MAVVAEDTAAQPLNRVFDGHNPDTLAEMVRQLRHQALVVSVEGLYCSLVGLQWSAVVDPDHPLAANPVPMSALGTPSAEFAKTLIFRSELVLADLGFV